MDPKEKRRQMWLAEVDKWAKQHDIIRRQAISILLDNLYPISIQELYKWAEADDFICSTASEFEVCGFKKKMQS